MRTAPRQRGGTMIEALIALFVLSFSALAYVGLQLKGLTGNSSAMWRSKAVQYAAEMGDRIRSNPVGVAAGNYGNLIGAPAAPGCGSTTACSTSDMAQLDYAQWRTALSDIGTGIPNGVGFVCVDSTPDDGKSTAPACDGLGTDLAVKVFWQERGEEFHVWSSVRP